MPKASRPSQKKRGLGVVLAGDFETGKTYFIATAPEPIIILDWDGGTEALWEQYDYITGETYEGNFSDKDIRVLEFRIDEEMNNSGLGDNPEYEFQTSLINALEEFELQLAKVITAAKAGLLAGGTVAMETASWLWMACMDHMKYEVLKLDETAKAYVKQQWDWDHANKKYINIYKQLMGLRRYGVNVIITVHTKAKYEEYEEKGKTKVRKSETEEKFHWMKKSPQMSPLILHTMKRMRMVDTGHGSRKAMDVRETTFVRLRGVPHATDIARPIYDITWDKLLEELHYIRTVHNEGDYDRPLPKRNDKRRGGKAADVATDSEPEAATEDETSLLIARRRRRRG